MKPVSTSELAPLHFNHRDAGSTKPFKACSNRIAWLRGIADKPNAKFNITIKDGLGRIKLQKFACKSGQSKEYGELVNLETMLGEDLQVTVDGIEGAENIQLFLN